MKLINIVVIYAMLLFSVGAVSAVSFTDMTHITTDDSTPTIPVTVTGNNTSYICNLFIDNAPSGVGTLSNNTLSSITCNHTLTTGVHLYNISAYNATENPTLTYSSDYTISLGGILPYPDINVFESIVELVRDTIPAISALKDIVVVVGTILILLVVVIGLRKTFGGFVTGFGSFFKKK